MSRFRDGDTPVTSPTSRVGPSKSLLSKNSDAQNIAFRSDLETPRDSTLRHLTGSSNQHSNPDSRTITALPSTRYPARTIGACSRQLSRHLRDALRTLSELVRGQHANDVSLLRAFARPRSRPGAARLGSAAHRKEKIRLLKVRAEHEPTGRKGTSQRGRRGGLVVKLRPSRLKTLTVGEERGGGIQLCRSFAASGLHCTLAGSPGHRGVLAATAVHHHLTRPREQAREEESRKYGGDTSRFSRALFLQRPSLSDANRTRGKWSQSPIAAARLPLSREKNSRAAGRNSLFSSMQGRPSAGEKTAAHDEGENGGGVKATQHKPEARPRRRT